MYAGICSRTTSRARAPSTACVVNGKPSPRATHSAHDCSATPHCSSPPPFVIESPRARTPRFIGVLDNSRGFGGALRLHVEAQVVVIGRLPNHRDLVVAGGEPDGVTDLLDHRAR